MGQLLKTTKRYVINTNTVNNRGFRLLSEGVDQSKYINNSIMLWMHYRACGASKTEVLPLGVIKEIEIDANGVMTGQPYFDSSDDFAVSIYNKYENGTLNMFSIGAVPLEVSLEPEDLLPGQTGPTVTKSLLKEISAVDIGGNAEAYGVALYDENDNEIQLSDDLIQTLLPTDKTKNTDMKVTTISVVGLLPMLKLADTAGENDVIEAFKGLITLRDEQAQKIITLNDSLTAETGKLTALQTKFAELEKKTGDDAYVALVDKSVNDRLITRKEGDNYIALKDSLKLEGLNKLLDGKTPNPSIKDTLANNTKPSVAEAELVKLREMNYDQLFEIDGAITKLQDGDPDRWKEVYLAKFPNAKIK